MKILHLLYESKGDYFGIGGVGKRAYEIYGYLKGRHDITLLCRRYPGAEDGDIEGLRHIFAGAESRNFTKTLLSYAYHSSRFVKRHGAGYDVIIEEFSPAIPRLLGLYRKRPVVLQAQGYTGRKYFEKYNILYSSALYTFERILPLTYSNIIVVSEGTKTRYRLDGTDKNVVVISNGINKEFLIHEPGEADYILYLGRIDVHNKGLDILLSAYSGFFKAYPGIRLVVAGDGRDREEFFRILNGLPDAVRKNIELKGWVDGPGKIHLLKDALMVVVPSRYETQGIVALEALAAGKAVVASDIPELRYITDKGAGVSFKSGDASSLAACIKNLTADSERKSMGQRGREWVRDFTWDRVAVKFEEYLTRVVNG